MNPNPSRGPRRVLVVILGLLAIAAAGVLLPGFLSSLGDGAGRPGDPDLNLERLEGRGRDDVIATLTRHLERRPDDLRAWLFLARAQSEAGRYDEAATAFEQALRDGGKLSVQASVWSEYAETLALRSDGRFAGAPAQAIERALALSPKDRKALELAGSAALEAGDYARALERWSTLLEQLTPGSPEHGQLLSAIEKLEARSGVMRSMGR